MSKIKKIEELLAGWKASELKHHNDGLAYLAGIHQGSIDALTEALEIFKEPSNDVNATSLKPCAKCKDYVKSYFFKFCPMCGLALNR